MVGSKVQKSQVQRIIPVLLDNVTNTGRWEDEKSLTEGKKEKKRVRAMQLARITGAGKRFKIEKSRTRSTLPTYTHTYAFMQTHAPAPRHNTHNLTHTRTHTRAHAHTHNVFSARACKTFSRCWIRRCAEHTRARLCLCVRVVCVCARACCVWAHLTGRSCV